MHKNIFFFFPVLLILPQIIVSQSPNANRKKISATRILKAPKIDGLINDDAWKNTVEVGDFF
ncbi:MAG TPA: hypothetical protein DDE71_04205, partial [Tenacibaculum sp.]|nr:hypothetical protein [Tenacibaculum sp.]